eukprot:GILI01008225.1.p2 GENE.GILI01008225.1~~GILI01008225.1.p2  ORF type:complete len:108 (-),score=18.32 GILI01008225.1:176-499(-)
MPNLAARDPKYRLIFYSFAAPATGRLSRDSMIKLIVATCEGVSERQATEQTALALSLADEYEFLEGHVTADGVDWEGFKAAYVEFAQNDVDHDLFMLEAFGLLAAAH